MKRRLRKIAAYLERIRQLPMLRWLGPRLHDPAVWHMGRNGCARGAAIGLFIGLLVPFAQIPAAAVLAIAMRANLAVAVVGTLVTNPFTIAPIYYLAYMLGSYVLGLSPSTIDPGTFHVEAAEVAGWLDIWSQRVVTIGKPLFLGLLLMATLLAGAAYGLINWTWRVLTMRAWRRRRRQTAIAR